MEAQESSSKMSGMEKELELYKSAYKRLSDQAKRIEIERDSLLQVVRIFASQGELDPVAKPTAA